MYALTPAGRRQRDIVIPVVEWADTFLLPWGRSLRGWGVKDIEQSEGCARMLATGHFPGGLYKDVTWQVQ